MANGVRGSYPILQKAVLRAWGGGETEKAECSTALRGSRGKYKLASSASFAQIFFCCAALLCYTVWWEQLQPRHGSTRKANLKLPWELLDFHEASA